MMGRLDDIEGAEKDPMIMDLGFATGGGCQDSVIGEEMDARARKLEAVSQGTRLTVVESGFDLIPAERRNEA